MPRLSAVGISALQAGEDVKFSMGRLQTIQALRGIAVLGVVLFHALAIERKYSGGDSLLPGFLLLGQSGVDLFFVISGFVMVTVTKGRFAHKGEMARFLWGRFTRIYPTYWFYFFLTLSVFLIKPDWVNSSQGHQAELLSSFFLLPDHQLPLVMVAWSLVHELWFYLVFTVLLWFRERLLLPSLIFWGVIIIAVDGFVAMSDLSPAARIAFHPYSLEFIIGALVAWVFSADWIPKLSAHSAAAVIALVLFAGLPLADAFKIFEQSCMMRVSTIGTLYGLLVLAGVTLEKQHALNPPRVLQFIGDISYTVYLSHVLVLSAIGRLWVMASPKPGDLFDNMLACPVMLAAVVCYGWVGYRLVERPILQVTRRIRARYFETDSRNAADPGGDTNAAR